MVLPEQHLAVKKSGIPGAGKGLFAKKFISKGTRIAEYTGKITTWKEVDHKDGQNAYIFYVNRNYVIDAWNSDKVLAKYANDARGLTKIKGIKNNSHYEEDGLRVFLTAVRDISAGDEILAEYGKEYWDIVRYNQSIDRK
ncbi:SET domain-containing protein [Chitinophagaceae bacterium LWZ2-11]